MNKNENYFAAFIGTALEFYDFALFGLLAPIFSTQFFLKDDPVAALILSYGIFATGFLIRPLGGILFGYIGDMYGRKRAMVISIIAMMIPTSLMGILPTYAHVGILAPVLLILCRLIQGLCVGGEFSGAAIFIIEHAGTHKKYTSGSLVTASSVIGMLVASAVSSLCVLELAPGWSWRVPFLLSIPIGLFGFYIRTHTQETKAFNRTQKNPHIKNERLFLMFQENYKSILITAGIGCFIGILYYVPFVFMGHYHTLVSSLTASTTLSVITFGLITYMLFLCIAGYLADQYTPQRVMLTAIFCINLLVYPIFWLINSQQFSFILAGELLLAALAGMFVGPANGLTASLFETQRRCRGVSFSLNLGISLFGGLTPLLLTYIINKTQMMAWPIIWIMFGSLIAACSVLASFKMQQKIT